MEVRDCTHLLVLMTVLRALIDVCCYVVVVLSMTGAPAHVHPVRVW